MCKKTSDLVEDGFPYQDRGGGRGGRVITDDLGDPEPCPLMVSTYHPILAGDEEDGTLGSLDQQKDDDKDKYKDNDKDKYIQRTPSKSDPRDL